MSEIPFHATRMGQRFYEHTMPELVRQLAKLNENLEKVIENRAEGEPDLTEPSDRALTDGSHHEEPQV